MRRVDRLRKPRVRRSFADVPDRRPGRDLRRWPGDGLPSKELTRLALAMEQRREHRRGSKEWRLLTTEIKALRRRLNLAAPYRYDLDLAGDLLALLDAAGDRRPTTRQLILELHQLRASTGAWIPGDNTVKRTIRELEREGGIEAVTYEGQRVREVGSRWQGAEGNKVRPRRWKLPG